MTGPVQPLPGEDDPQHGTDMDVVPKGRSSDNWYPSSDLDQLGGGSSGGRFGRGGGGYRPHHDDLQPSAYETYIDQPSNSAGMITNTRELERFLKIAMDNGLSEAERTRVMSEYLEQNKRNVQLLQTNREFDLDKKRSWMKFKMIVGTTFVVAFIIFILVFIGVFVYLALNKGLLSDGSFIEGFFNTIQEVLKIILTSS